MSDTKLVRGRWIITGGAETDAVLTDAAVRVDGGTIAEVGDWGTLRAGHPDATVVGSERVAIMPGMVNAHHHSNGVSAIQQGIQDRLLESWLLSLSLGRGLEPRLGTLLSAARLLRTGVTSVVDVHSDRGTADAYAANARAALEAYDAAGIRVAFADCLARRVLDDYDAIVDTCCKAWNDRLAMPDRLASITRRNRAKAS